MYAIELDDNEPNEYALDEVVVSCTGGKTKLEEFSQQHIAEDIFSHRIVSEEEYLRVFDETNDYLKAWTPEQKKKYIYKSEKIKEVEE
jgi:hypothetical protein